MGIGNLACMGLVLRVMSAAGFNWATMTLFIYTNLLAWRHYPIDGLRPVNKILFTL